MKSSKSWKKIKDLSTPMPNTDKELILKYMKNIDKGMDVLNILLSKNVDIWCIKQVKTASEYNDNVGFQVGELTYIQFRMIKEVLKDYAKL